MAPQLAPWVIRSCSSSVCYVTILFLQGFHLFNIYLLGLRHWSVLRFDCSIFCLLRHYKLTISSRFPLFHYICLLHHCSVLGFGSLLFCLLRHYTISSSSPLFPYLFAKSLLCSRLRLVHLLVVTSLYYYINKGLHCFVICLFRHWSVLGLSCLLFCLLRHCTISLSSPLFHYQLVIALAVLGFDCSIFCLLRHYAISSRLPLFHYL